MSLPYRRDVPLEELEAGAQKLLDAAYEYWTLMQEAGRGGALFWLDDSSGRTVIFTRGEYRSHLLSNIDSIRFGDMAKVQFQAINTAPGSWDKPEDTDLNEPLNNA